ncbi:putative membrane protein [Propionispora sp. 2/2-37]|nr:putative membrane protein [Propionispora sp. 2/2-37]
MQSMLVRKNRFYFAIASLIFVSLLASLIGFEFWDEQELAAIPNQPAVPPAGKVSLVVKVQERMLEVYDDGVLYKQYRIAVGDSDTPTPVGDWTVIWKAHRSGDIMGTRFMALDVPWGGYGIHGTNRPWSIGHFISKGCIRLRNRDVEELFEWVPVGTPVRIVDKPQRIGRILRYESMGADVVELQRKLRALGYLEGRADGFFNRDTETAVKRFQHDRGRKPSGVVDKETLNLLGL